MRIWMMTLAALVALPAAASAQEEMERRMQELQREHEKARKQLEERFRGEMERLEQEFKKRAEEFHRGHDQRGEKRDERGRDMQPGTERLAQALHQLMERVERLEQMLKGRGGEERRDFRPEERGHQEFRPEERRGNERGRPDMKPEERRGEERGRPGMDCPCKGKCEHCHPRPGDRKPERKPDHQDYY